MSRPRSHLPTSTTGEPDSPAISRSPTPATTAINGWTLSFDFVGAISSIWNATHRQPRRQSLRDPGCRLQRVDRRGPERDDRLQRLARPTRLRADELCLERRIDRVKTPRLRSAASPRPKAKRLPFAPLPGRAVFRVRKIHPSPLATIVVEVDNRSWHRANSCPFF